MDEGSIIIELDDDNEEEPSHEAFVFFPLYDGDEGFLQGRETRPEFINRQPACVHISNNMRMLRLDLFNLGNMTSDLVGIEYEIIFCTLDLHGVSDAYTSSHAHDIPSTQLDKLGTLASLAPKEVREFIIELPPVPPFAANLYFRARASTLWEPSKPMDEWRFSKDVKVTEFYKRLV